MPPPQPLPAAPTRDLAPIAFALLVAVVVLGGLLALFNVRELETQRRLVAHTLEVQTALERLLSSVKDGESGQRGFLLTGDDRYLKPYNEAKLAVAGETARVRNLTLDDPAQQARIDVLDRLIAEKMAELEATIALARGGDAAAALQIVGGGEGKRVLDAARAVVNDMEAAEEARLTVRAANATTRYRLTLATIAGGTLLAITLLSAAFVRVRRDARRRQQAADSVAEQRERLRITLQSIGDGVIATDAAGNVTFMNPVAEALTGWTGEHAAGEPLSAVFVIVNEATRQPVDNPALRALREGVIVGLANHTLLIAKDGTARPIDDSAAPIRLRDGLAGAILVFRDVTSRREAERDLRKSRELLETRVVERTDALARSNHFMSALLENVQDGIVACDANGVLTLFNRATRRFHGLPQDSLPAEQWADHYDLYHADGRTRMEMKDVPLFRALHGEHVEDAEMVIAAKHAPARTLLASGQAFHDEHGALLGAVVSMHDITQRRAAETELRNAHEALETRVIERTQALSVANETLRAEISERRNAEQRLRENEDALRCMTADLSEADRRKDEFLATLAHELRNPLAPMRNGLHILKLADRRSDAIGEVAGMMDRQLRQMVRLVDDLLDVSRITRNKLELRRERVALATLIENAIETCRPLIEANGHALEISLPELPVYIDADATRMAQVFSNLLNNAAKYTDRAGRIRVAAAVTGAGVVVSVGDNGIGIPPAMLSKVFEMFAQVDRALERAQGGLGIGLTLVKRLVEMHGGSVEAKSDGTGKGSEFVVRLPVAAAAPAETVDATEPPAPLPSRRWRILVIEDNADAADSLNLLLRLLGHDTRVERDGLAAVDAARDYRPEVILLDIGLPRLNGYEACRRIRAQTAAGRPPVIVACTGWGQEADRQRAQEAGFNFHMVKPIDVVALEKLLSTLADVSVL